MKRLITSLLLGISLHSYPQSEGTSMLFGKEWKTPYAVKHTKGQAIDNAFPTGFKITKERNRLYRKTYFLHPMSQTDTFSQAIDTLDLKKKIIAYSKAGRKIESTIALSKDERQMQVKRKFFYADDPKKLEFSVDETIELLDNGDAIIRKTAKATDPDSPWNFVGEKVYPKDGEATENQNK